MPATKKPTATRLSALNLLASAKTIAKRVNEVWSVAPKSKMFTRKLDPSKKYKRWSSDKKRYVEYSVIRTNKLLSGHAIKIAASGAAQHVNAIFAQEASAYKAKTRGEAKRSPWLPAVTPGAALLLEQFLSAYAQEATANARDVRIGLTTVHPKEGEPYVAQKRLSGASMKVGFDAADARIFGALAMAPRKTIVCALPKKSKKAAEGGEGEGAAEAKKA